MSDLYDDGPDQYPDPDELCKQAFSRCSNWPQDRAGQLGLAQGLRRASEQFHISQEDLIEKCREFSAFCPTDADLLRVAGDMYRVHQDAMEAARDRGAEWKKQYGPSKPADLGRGKCLDCGRDWKEILKTSGERNRLMWAQLREHFGIKANKGKWPQWRDMAPVARKLGYEDYARAWERL